MASRQIDENSLVYSYLLKKSPKCAEIFSKTNRVTKLPLGSPTLEDIIQSALSDTVASKVQLSKRGTSEVNEVSKDSSSDSSSDSEQNNSTKPNIHMKDGNKLVNVSLNKKKSSSSDSDSSPDSKNKPVLQTPINKAITTNKKDESSNDSEDEKNTSKVLNIPLKITPSSKQNLKASKKESSSSDSEDEPPKTFAKSTAPVQNLKAPIQKARDSSSSDDSDSEPNKVPLNSNKSIVGKQLPKTPQIPAFTKKSDSSSDSSSDSGNEVQKAKPLSNKPNNSTVMSKGTAESSESESEDEKGMVVSLAKKMSTPLNVSKQVPSSSIPRNTSVSKLGPGNKKQDDSSDDSSSESEDELYKNSQGKCVAISSVRNLPVHTPSLSAVGKSPVSKQVSPASIPRNVSVSKLGPVNKKQDDSSDDSSSESEDEPYNNSQGKCVDTSSVKNLPVHIPSLSAVGKSPMLLKPNLKKGKSSSSEDSSDVDDKTSKVQSSIKVPPQIVRKLTHDVSSSEDSDDSSEDSSDSDAAKTTLKNSVNKGNGNQMKPSTALLSPKKTVSLSVRTKEASDSSSDSSDENAKASQRKSIGNIAISKTSNVPVKKVINKDNSSSSSDTEDEPVKNVPLKSPAVLPSKAKQTADSSSDSSSEEDKQVSQNTNQVKLVAKSNVIAQKASNRKDSSSSGSDSDDDRPQPVTSTTATKNVKSPGLSNKKNSSSDSSTDDENDKLPMKMSNPTQLNLHSIVTATQNIVNRMENNRGSSSSTSSEDETQTAKPALGLKPSSKESSSDSDDETHTVQKSVSKVTTLKPALGLKSSGKKSSSSDSSDSEEEAEKSRPVQKQMSSNINTKQKTVKRPVNGSGNSSMAPKKFAGMSSGVCAVQMKQKESSSDDSSSSEDESTFKTNAPVTPKPSVLTSGKTTVKSSSSSDSESDQATKKVSIVANEAKDSKASKRKKPSSSEENDESESLKKKPFNSDNQSQKQADWQPATSTSNQSQTFKNQHEGRNPIASDSTKRRGSSPFRRVKSENFVVDYRLKQSAELAKQSLPSFQGVRGKQFRHEKTKKKRMAAFGGKVDTTVKSIKYDD